MDDDTTTADDKVARLAQLIDDFEGALPAPPRPAMLARGPEADEGGAGPPTPTRDDAEALLRAKAAHFGKLLRRAHDHGVTCAECCDALIARGLG